MTAVTQAPAIVRAADPGDIFGTGVAMAATLRAVTPETVSRLVPVIAASMQRDAEQDRSTR